MRAFALLAILTAVAVTAVGCGSSGSRSAASSRPAATPPGIPNGQPSAGNQGTFARFRQCLQQHGVKLPSSPPQGAVQGQPPSFNGAKIPSAVQACRQYAPSQLQGQAGSPFGG
jgi:hypothetical protein